MIKTTPIQTALIAALLGSVALVGCKKKEESTDSNAAPAATAPAEPAAPAPMTGAPSTVRISCTVASAPPERPWYSSTAWSSVSTSSVGVWMENSASLIFDDLLLSVSSG